MRSGILRARVASLRLRSDAPWPSALFEIDNDGNRWRYIFKALRKVSAPAKAANKATVNATIDRKA
jgi:hypothetical protein